MPSRAACGPATQVAARRQLALARAPKADPPFFFSFVPTPFAARQPAANVAPKERLMIKHMQMVNFKSYYGVQDVGPFHKVRPWQKNWPKTLLFQCFVR